MKFLIFGGTGSLGKALCEKIFQDEINEVCVVSRSEDKHRLFRLMFPKLKSIVGDVRDYNSCLSAIRSFKPNIIIAAQALKQIPIVEQQPFEGVLTNIIGTNNLCRAVEEYQQNKLNTIKFISISTDKAAAASTSYGMTKSLQERIHLSYNIPFTTCNVVRYGNVLSSTGSVIPIFKEKIKNNLPLQITDKRMTRFFMSLPEAVNLIMEAATDIAGKKTFLPKMKSAYITDLAECLMSRYDKKVELVYTGIRPSEKLNEILFSNEECMRIEELANKFILYDVNLKTPLNQVKKEYSSGDESNLMNKQELDKFLEARGIYDNL